MKLSDLEVVYRGDTLLVFLDEKRIVDPLEADTKEGWVDVLDETKFPDVSLDKDQSIDMTKPDQLPEAPIKRLYGEVKIRRLYAKKE